jgi:hypothetical protein
MGDFLKDFWAYMQERKKFWLLPFVLVLLVLGVIVILGQNAAIAPFIYTLF